MRLFQYFVLLNFCCLTLVGCYEEESIIDKVEASAEFQSALKAYIQMLSVKVEPPSKSGKKFTMGQIEDIRDKGRYQLEAFYDHVKKNNLTKEEALEAKAEFLDSEILGFQKEFREQQKDLFNANEEFMTKALKVRKKFPQLSSDEFMNLIEKNVNLEDFLLKGSSY